MDNIKYIGFGVLAVLAVVFGTLFLKGDTAPTYTYQAMSSPESTNNYQCYGGICTFYNRVAFTTATTTVCAIKSPAATSTLVNGAARFTVSSTTASKITLAKATSAFATTTSLGSASIAANAQGTVIATTTPLDALDEDKVFAPSQWFVVGMEGGVGTFSPTGICKATFETI